MSKNYKSLIKIIKNNLDTEASKLGKLNFELGVLNTEKNNKIKKLKNDARIVGDETLIYLAEFIKTLRGEIKMLDKLIEVKKKEVENQENIVRDIFIEKKKIELVESKNLEIEKINLNLKENKEIEDISLNIWNYNKKER